MFGREERFSVRYADALVRYRTSFAGRITTDGATGALRLRARVHNRRGTKLRTRCDSGTRTWNAAPAAATGGGGPAPSPPPAPPGGLAPSGVTMTSDPGDYLGEGRTYTLGGMREESIRGERVTLGAGDFVANFAAPPGQELTAGVHYPGARKYPFNESAPGLSVSGEGRGCGSLSGSFSVDEIAWSPDGTLQAFSARFEQHCDHAVPALRGTWTYRRST